MQTEKIVCKYCNKSFRKMSTISVHLCEKKRRWQQEGDTGVRIGFAAFLQFYTAAQGSAKNKTYGEFVDSPYYTAFVKFGQYLVQIRAINIKLFTAYLIKNNVRIDYWTKDIHYDQYLFDYLSKESPTDALERSFKEMQRWADEEEKQFNNIFRECSSNKICNMIINGRLSPWILYNCDSGVAVLSNLNSEQISLVFKFIEPTLWANKFKNYVADTEFIKMVLTEAKV